MHVVVPLMVEVSTPSRPRQQREGTAKPSLNLEGNIHKGTYQYASAGSIMTDSSNLRPAPSRPPVLQPLFRRSQGHNGGNYSIVQDITNPTALRDPRQSDCFDVSSTDGMVTNPVLFEDRGLPMQDMLRRSQAAANRRWLLLAICLTVFAVLYIDFSVPSATVLLGKSSPGSRSRTDCAKDFYLHQSSCQAWRFCQQLSSAGANSICQPCPTSTYQAVSIYSLETCQPHQLCTAGTFLNVSATLHLTMSARLVLLDPSKTQAYI
jgi:hypothetical protein